MTAGRVEWADAALSPARACCAPGGAYPKAVSHRCRRGGGRDGSVIELIRPTAKPSATGADWNWRSVAVETLNVSGAPEYAVTEAQLEELAQMIAWLATLDGKSLDGVPVSFTIDRAHVISHRETWSGTECPGPYLQSRLDDIVVRARQIFGDRG
ncbi:N-acetylmuramoyl-L-alanine amidase [Microbacterium sp. UCD-TDU]|uniref:N-acetylmuramoyl-L-alanine amidase n=1 Tax=Microbacterium TaxID=33882 RepID=UPI001F005835|nr:N-acetylmuramoyl-L-alanine amidase [Microbacterium sp. UCD-TDU]